MDDMDEPDKQADVDDVLVNCDRLDNFLLECLAETAFSHGFIQVFKSSDYEGSALFDGDASFLRGGLTVCGQRSVEHLSKDAYTTTADKEGVDTAASSGSSGGVDAWRSIPQEPGSLYIGNFSASKHQVAHAVEPLDCPSSTCSYVITLTLRTDIFDLERQGEANRATAYVCEPLLRGYVNDAVARFMSDRQPRMPRLSDVVQTFSSM